MNALVALQGNALPAHLAKPTGRLATLNEDAKAGNSFNAPPRISFRGKVFRIVIDGVEKSLTRRNEDGDIVPATSLKVVVVAANKGKYKTYYGDRKYNADDEAQAPICFSYDGERPSAHAESPQCASCAACPHNVFGSKITEQGNKTRACSDNKLLSVIEAGAVTKQSPADTAMGQAYQIKLPPTALGRSREDRKKAPQLENTSWNEYLEMLNNFPQGALSVAGVVTTITFDNDTDYPLPRFRAQRYLDETEAAFVAERAEDDDVLAAVTESGAAPATAAVAKPVAPAVAALVAPPPQPVPAPVAATPAAPHPTTLATATPEAPRRGRKPKQEAAPEPGSNDSISFDDPEPAKPAVAAKPAPANAAPPPAQVLGDDEAAAIEAMFS